MDGSCISKPDGQGQNSSLPSQDENERVHSGQITVNGGTAMSKPSQRLEVKTHILSDAALYSENSSASLRIDSGHVRLNRPPKNDLNAQEAMTGEKCERLADTQTSMPSPRFAPENPSRVLSVPVPDEGATPAAGAEQSADDSLERTRSNEKQLSTSSTHRKSPGLKLVIPTAVSSRSDSLTAYFSPRGYRKKKSSRAKSPKPRHSNTPASDYQSSINYSFGDISSGRRSAPIFSRRHFGGVALIASGDRGSDQNLRSIGTAARGIFSHWRDRKDKVESLRRTKSYGAFQTDSPCPDKHLNGENKPAFIETKTKLNTKDNDKLDRLSVSTRNLKNAAIGQGGYWSECETEGQGTSSFHGYASSHQFHPNDSLGGLLPSEYKLGWHIAHQSIFEDDDIDTGTPVQNRIARFPTRIRRCRSETPQIPSSRDERLVIDYTGKSPRISYGTYGNEVKRLGQFPDDRKGGGDDEKTPLIGSTESIESDGESSEVKTEVYARRWYILLVFSLYCLIWNAVWSTWGPIAQSAKAVFDWSDANIAMFTWLGNIPFLITMFPIAYLMDVKGMRIAMLLSCSLSFLGAGLRCITSDPDTATWLINAGQLLNGIAGTVPVSGSALVSGLWFPQNQRATATGISTIMGYLGVCISFVTGPFLVPEPDFSAPANTSSFSFRDSLNASNGTDLSVQRNGIMNLLYYECGVMGLVFFLVLVYFPSKPAVPPSVSASMPREGYVKGIKMLVRNKQFWLTAMAFSVPVGVYEVWQIVLDVNLDPKVSQETAGWMDFYATIGGCAAGLLVSRFADLFTRQMRLFLIVFYMLSAVSSLWFTLLALDILPFDMVSIYAATVICGLFLDGAAPLFFELVIEVSYPVGEGVTSGFLQMLCAGAGIVFLSLMQLESIGKSWMNWCLTACIAVSVPLLIFMQTPLGRADVDDGLSSSLDSADVNYITEDKEPEVDVRKDAKV